MSVVIRMSVRVFGGALPGTMLHTTVTPWFGAMLMTALNGAGRLVPVTAVTVHSAEPIGRTETPVIRATAVEDPAVYLMSSERLCASGAADVFVWMPTLNRSRQDTYAATTLGSTVSVRTVAACRACDSELALAQEDDCIAAACLWYCPYDSADMYLLELDWLLLVVNLRLPENGPYDAPAWMSLNWLLVWSKPPDCALARSLRYWASL